MRIEIPIEIVEEYLNKVSKNESVRDGFEVRSFKRAPLQKAVQIGNFALINGQVSY